MKTIKKPTPPHIPLNYPKREWWFPSKTQGGIDGRWLVTPDPKTGELHCECIGFNVFGYCLHIDDVMTEVTGIRWYHGVEIGKMVSEQEYNRKPYIEWRGKKVRTLTEMQNGCNSIPVGTICTITGKQGGFSLETEPCEKCGVRVFITKVEPTHVELV